MNDDYHIGITPNPDRKKGEIEKSYTSITDWKVFGPYTSLTEAKLVMKSLVKNYLNLHISSEKNEPNVRYWWVFFGKQSKTN